MTKKNWLLGWYSETVASSRFSYQLSYRGNSVCIYVYTHIRTLQRQEDDDVICPPCHPPRRLSCELCHHSWLQIQILSEAASLFTACLGRIILCFALCNKSLSCKCMQHVLLVNTLLSILLLQLLTLSLKGTGEGERGAQGKKKRPSFLVPVLTAGYSLLMGWRGTGASCDIVKATTVYIHVHCNSHPFSVSIFLLWRQFAVYHHTVLPSPKHTLIITSYRQWGHISTVQVLIHCWIGANGLANSTTSILCQPFMPGFAAVHRSKERFAYKHRSESWQSLLQELLLYLYWLRKKKERNTMLTLSLNTVLRTLHQWLPLWRQTSVVPEWKKDG